MRGKLTESVRLLKELKEKKDTAESISILESEGKRHEEELERVRDELARREMQAAQRAKVEKESDAALKAQEESIKQAKLKEQLAMESTIIENKRDRSAGGSVLGLQDFL